MKYFYSLVVLLFPLSVHAAAPDDIGTNQRGWYDAVDLNANDDYTDNPANNTAISLWSDKSGAGNSLTQSGTQRPLYHLDNLLIGRHGLVFDGVDDELVNANDIWIGTVDSMESFVVATTDNLQTSSLFASSDNSLNRLSAHIPWNDGITYFDHGICCGAPTRLNGTISIGFLQQYVWHFIGLPGMQAVLQDGKIALSDSGSSIYYVTSNSSFSLGGWPVEVDGHIHGGRYFEAIFYQAALSSAQRRILNSYLSAKWGTAFAALPTYSDVYQGDTAGNGDYDFFVGGIGQDNGTQTSGTSQGLTITDNSFLTANEKFILAGVNYLVTTPLVGSTASDMPTGYASRSNRSWYIDRTGSNGLVNLSFDAVAMGLTVDNSGAYGLLHRTGTSGTFTEVSTALMVSGVINFSHLPDDGVYVIGKKGVIELSIQKTTEIVSDPFNASLNPKSIPGSTRDYTLTVKNTGTGKPDAETTVINDVLPNDLTLFTGDLDGNGSPFVFTDSSCPPETATLSSDLTLDYLADVILKDAAGTAVTSTAQYDASVRSFEITMTGRMNASAGALFHYSVSDTTGLNIAFTRV